MARVFPAWTPRPEGRASGASPRSLGRPRFSSPPAQPAPGPFPNPPPRNGRSSPCHSGQRGVLPRAVSLAQPEPLGCGPSCPGPAGAAPRSCSPLIPPPLLGAPPPPALAPWCCCPGSGPSPTSQSTRPRLFPYLSQRHPRSHAPPPPSERAPVPQSPSQPGPPFTSQLAPILGPSCYGSSKPSRPFVPILSHHVSLPSSPSRTLAGTLLSNLLKRVNLH